MIKQLFANIGYEVYAKKVTSANFYMFTICQRCLSVFSILNLMPVQTKSVLFYTLTPVRRRRIVLGMIEAFVGTDQTVGISILSE